MRAGTTIFNVPCERPFIHLTTTKPGLWSFLTAMQRVVSLRLWVRMHRKHLRILPDGSGCWGVGPLTNWSRHR
jgi:hypothetical protein